MPTRSSDPVGNYNFRIEIEGVEAGSFSDISGLSLETEVIAYRSGGTRHEQKLPGRHSVGDITLKRGYTNTTDLWDWYQTVLQGEIQRRGVVIKVLDEKFEPYLQFSLAEAWPRKYVGPLLDASGNDAAIEEIVIVCEAINLA